MQTSEQRTADRLERLSRSVNLAAKLRPVVDDPDVSEYLDGIEHAMVESLITASTSEDRDRVAAEIKAWRKVRATLRTIAHGGKHSQQKIEQLTRGQSYE